MLNAYAGIKTAAVSYRGTPQATTDLLGGQIDFVVMDVSQTQEHIKAGKLRTLAVTGPTRMEIFPDAPTMIELGYPDFVLYSWNGVHVPPACRRRSSRPQQGDPRCDPYARGQALLRGARRRDRHHVGGGVRRFRETGIEALGRNHRADRFAEAVSSQAAAKG